MDGITTTVLCLVGISCIVIYAECVHVNFKRKYGPLRDITKDAFFCVDMNTGNFIGEHKGTEYIESIKRWQDLVVEEDHGKVVSTVSNSYMHDEKSFCVDVRINYNKYEKKWVVINGNFNKKKDRMYLLMTDIDGVKKQDENVDLITNSLTAGAETVNTIEKKIKNAIKNADLKKTMAVVVVEINGFGVVRNSEDNGADETFLKLTNKCLISYINEDILFRFTGSNRFVGFVSLPDKDDVIELLKCIQNELKTSYSLSINTNIGVAFYDEHGEDCKELLSSADIAVRNAKYKGKSNLIVYDADMGHVWNKKAVIEKRLHEAVKNMDFEIYYQPQFEFTHTTLRGFEALLRWNDSVLGFVSPADFIPIAEENGMILKIGEWVLRQSCETWVRWQREFDIPDAKISINISVVQLLEPNFIEIVDDVLETYNIDTRNIEFEITESAFIDNMEVASGTLNKLKERGINIALDDFGTGYSSLTYLKDFPIDTLKIDKSFISNIHINERERYITDALIELVHRLEIETIAEGVENIEQFNFLKHMNCDNIQGYYTGKPMDNKQIEKVIFESAV